ncbi:conserved Plasmodium protein, unknown function [Plasmodium ovale wallikeri]|uniref:RAP protein n=1 Tax=Plasmodium ovale wallikeri TaxID=864142 RepID=A0A1A8ZGA9_PLAOA|nr:conserved Plasmodium protein, unknown function [Plasmodium ovale wallikeri]
MFKSLFFQLFECREKYFFVLHGPKWDWVCFAKKNHVVTVCSNLRLTKRKDLHREEVPYRKVYNSKYGSLHIIRRNFITVINNYLQINDLSTPQKEDRTNEEKDIPINQKTEVNSLEKILDETNSLIYINEICFKMDRSILKCQTYEDILSILVTHRGVMFLQNLLTAIRMLAGFVNEEKRQKVKIQGEYNTRPIKYDKYVECEKTHNTEDNLLHNDDLIETKEYSTFCNDRNTLDIYKNSGKMFMGKYEETGFDKIEKNVIEKYRYIFDALNNRELLESENTFQRNRNIEEILIVDERFNLLIDDIYKNRKHFDVISICHILISLKELNYKYFPLFNSFVNALKNFDVYIKEQFESNKKIDFINSSIQLLLQCFNAYIWAGYYNLDVYNMLINSILLNKFVHIKNQFMYEQHYEQLNNYIYMNYKYNVNYPLRIEDVLAFFNLNKGAYIFSSLSKGNHVPSTASGVVPLSVVNNCFSGRNDKRVNIEGESGHNDEMGLEKEEGKEKGDTYVTPIGGNKDASCYCCPVFLNLELFLRSVEIYKNVYSYNPIFFKTSEKIVYYYTQYLTPSNLGMIAEAFSKHHIFVLEHDRVFFHIAKILENNFDKFSYENIFHILRSFKKMSLFFENCIILSADKFKKYFDYLYINRKVASLTLKDISILMESLSFFNFTHKYIEEFIKASLNYLEDYIDDIDEETSINISYALVLSNLFHVNTYFFSFIWRKIGKTTYWEKRKNQVCLLWLSHMIQFKWMQYDLPKFCVLECVKVFYLKRKENMFSSSKIIPYISKLLDELEIPHEVFVDIYGPYILDILIKNNKRQVIMLTQDTTRNEINRSLGDSKIISNHLKLYGYNVRYINTTYFDTLSGDKKKIYVKNILTSF